MNPCIACGLALPPGASHADLSDCVRALRHALDEARTCPVCRKTADQCEGRQLACAPCGAAALAKKHAGTGLLWAGQKIMERLAGGQDGAPATGKRASDGR